ncbi:hypothetical protein [uncultured Sphingomonas sp.]|uniref:hypothetical protein n=1 Tax=uncultured Sphingomonas sp. TaxID=158754 RepID=UPI0035CC0E4F
MTIGVFEFVIILVLIGTVGKIIQARYQAHPARPVPEDHAEVTRAREEVRQLKERIQVLERVITDNHGSNELDREIERLRDR